MQKIVTDRLRPAGKNDEIGVRDARSALAVAYGMIEQRMATRQWAIGDVFTLADCSAAPALFFAAIVQPFAPRQHALSNYLERLLVRPSVARTVDEARPYFSMFPYKDAMPVRFLVSETA
jgi:glutathione S-transferase